MLHTDYAHLAAFIDNLPAVFDTEGELIYSMRNIVKRFVAPDGMPLIVKRYKLPNFIQRFAYTFYRPSKARRAYEYAIRLLNMGIDTPAPIAYIEQKRHFMFSYGFFVSKENNSPSCKALLNDEFNDKQLLATDFMKFVAHLHSLGVMHGDTNLSNFLYEKRGDNYHFAVIDTNRSSFLQPPVSDEKCIGNLMRITHDIPLLRKLVGIYAEIRGWNPDETADKVVKSVHAFEQRTKFKHLFRIRHHKK